MFYILHDNFNLKIYNLYNMGVKFWIKSNEIIKTISFTTLREDFFVITEKAKIKKYKLNENTGEIKLFR